MSMFQVPSHPHFNIHFEVIEGLSPVNLFFIHGNLASNNWWQPTLDVMKKSKESGSGSNGKIVLAEFRGCGGSTPPRSLEDVNMDLFANDFVQLIQHLGLKDVVVVGHSAGGFIAALMMTQAPELFKGALLLDPVGMKGVTFDVSMTQAFEQMKSNKELVGLVLGGTIHGLDPQNKFFREVLLEDGFRSVQQVGHWVIQALDGADIQSKVSSIQKPVLVLHGEFDTLLPRKDSEDFARHLKKGQFEIIPQQGHCCNFENPELFTQRLQKFIRELDGFSSRS
jgi:pimeloyl-ACP methyl ester carboxylesterase